MDWQIIGAFVVATTVLLATPGPVMAVLIGNTVNGGQTVGFCTVLGIGLGEVVLVGLLAVSLMTSSQFLGQVFPWLSLASAAYLAWLAMKIFLRPDLPAQERVQSRSPRPFFDGLAITVSNPAALLFYSAFFMPFIEGSDSVAAQLWLLATLYLLTSLTFDIACVLFVAHISAKRIRGEFFARVSRFCSALVYLATSALAISSFLRATT